MSKESLQDRTGILERWSRVFDNSFAPSVTQILPKVTKSPSVEDVLELEDVIEEVHDEVPQARGGGRHMEKPAAPKLPIKRVQRRRSVEQVSPEPPGRTQLPADKCVHSRRVLLPKPVSPRPRPMSFQQDRKKDDTPIKPSSASTGRPPSGRVRARDNVNTPPRSAKQPKPAIQVKPVVPGGSPITLDMAKSLRKLLFGSTYASFNMDWRKQHINFSDSEFYGLSFYKPGPAGVLACLQAFLMKHLLYINSAPTIPGQSLLQPMSSDRQKALVSAMAQMMWQAGGKKQAMVALACGECQWRSYDDYRLDQLTENLVVFEFGSLDELQKFIKRHISFFENISGDGCILLLYSVILSRTIPRVYEDLCEPNTTLMGSHDTCSQAMVNLLLTGRASRKVFNGDVEYNKRGTLLPYPEKGVKGRSEIGFLTLWEHLDHKEIEVGSMLKTPKYPVWVVDSTGGRYGIVFCLNKDLVNDWRLERRFELYYYNGTSRYSTSTGEIITIDTRDIVDEVEITEDTHPVEHCLRTKWPGAVIDWT